MQDTFAITIIFILICAVVGAFMKGRKRDKCLMSFQGDLVTLEKVSGKTVWGKLSVETTGLEFLYPEAYKDKDGHDELSYILYKGEFSAIHLLVRYYEDLDEKGKKRREKELRRTYHPTLIWRLKRKILNIFKTVRDSVMEIVNIFIDVAKKKSPAGALMTSQDKYVSRIKEDVTGFMGTAFEPLLEKHIGSKVVLELKKGSEKYEHVGILKDYTAEYIELLNVDYKLDINAPSIRKADIIVPREQGLIRHLGE